MNSINEKISKSALSLAILEDSKELNLVLTQTKKVRAVFHTHYVNVKTQDFGIADLILSILTNHGASYPMGIETTEMRGMAIASSMFTSEIMAEVEKAFTVGTIRYPLQTVKNYLSVFMAKNSTIGKIQLTNSEDKNRTCPKPRCKWYAPLTINP